MSEWYEATLTELSQAIRNRTLSPLELMEAVLARIDKINPELNAIVSMREVDALLEEARAAEDRVMAGQARPLEGIPLGVKDLEAAAGLPHTEGSLLFKDRVAEQDSTQVTRLKAAGAIVLGKTNTPEFGHTAVSKNLVYGTTRSPWNPERTPGGSSGGSSAALTGGLLPLVTASDGGGSIRIPASFTGSFGFKPTFGLVPRGPFAQWTYGDTSHYGPLTKTVEDAALFLDQVVGLSPDDPTSLRGPDRPFLDIVQEPLQDRLRIAFSPDFGYGVVQSDVAAMVEDAARVFERLGHTLEQVPGGPPLIGADWNLLNSFENASRLSPFWPERRGEITRAYAETLERCWNITPERWGEAAVKRIQVNEWCRDLFAEFDLLLTPTVPYDPPPAGGPFPEETEGRPQVPAGVAVFTIPFNQSGCPAASVRAGLSKAGLPVGLQIVGPRQQDGLVLRAARDFEAERPWHPDWPI